MVTCVHNLEETDSGGASPEESSQAQGSDEAMPEANSQPLGGGGATADDVESLQEGGKASPVVAQRSQLQGSVQATPTGQNNPRECPQSDSDPRFCGIATCSLTFWGGDLSYSDRNNPR